MMTKQSGSTKNAAKTSPNGIAWIQPGMPGLSSGARALAFCAGSFGETPPSRARGSVGAEGVAVSTTLIRRSVGFVSYCAPSPALAGEGWGEGPPKLRPLIGAIDRRRRAFSTPYLGHYLLPPVRENGFF